MSEPNLVMEVEDLRLRLGEAEDALRAIRRGEVDGVVVAGTEGERVFLLKGAEQPYRIFLENMSDGAVTLLADGSISYSNRRFAEMLQTPLEQVIGAPLATFVQPDHRHCLPPLLAHALTGSAKGEVPFLARDGTAVWAELSLSPAGLENAAGTCMIATDISERRRADESLRRASAYNRSLIEASLDPLVTIAPDGTITDVNSAAEKATGCSRDEMIGTAFSSYFTDPERARMGYRQVFERGWTQDLELEIRHRNGATIPVLFNASVCRTDAGETVGIFAARDITERRRSEEQINESRRRASSYNRRLIEASLDPLVAIAPDGTISDVNSATEKATGCSRDEMIGTDFSSYFTDPEKARMGYRQVFERGLTQDFELEIRHRNGTTTPVVYNASIYRDEAGETVGIFAAARDITERLRSEEQIRYLADIVQTSDAAIVGKTPDGIITSWNLGAERIYGYTKEEALGRSITMLSSPERGDEMQLILNSIRRGERLRHLETTRLRKDLRRITVSLTVSPIINAAGRIIGASTIAHDVTERKWAEDQLAIQAKIAKIFLTISDDRMYREVLKVILEALESEQGVFGYIDANGDCVIHALVTGEESMRCDSIFVPRAAWEDSRWARALTGKKTEFSNAVSDRTSEEHVPVRRHITVPIILQEEVIGLLQAANRPTDYMEADVLTLEAIAAHLAPIVSARLQWTRAEEEIRQLNAGLERRVAERTADLVAVNKELEAFSYSVSHDLRAPLRALVGFSRILLQEHATQLDGQGQHYLEVIQQNAGRMGELVDDLLAFSRLGRQPLTRQPVIPARLVGQALEELLAEHQGREVQIVVSDLPPCEAEPVLLRQVFINLLSNALKYTRHRDPARIEVGVLRAAELPPGLQTGGAPQELPDPDTPVYYVKDNGVGFDMRYADKLFGVFQRLHRMDEYEGNGVGLATVQRIVHRHGGQVWGLAEVNQGATFYFTIGEAGEPRPEHDARRASA